MLRVIETTTDVPATIALPGRPPRPNPCAILADPTGDVVHGDCPVFDVFVDSPSSMRSLQGGTGPVGTITYRNRAFVAIPLPYLDIRGRNVEILVDGQPAHVTGTQIGRASCRERVCQYVSI